MNLKLTNIEEDNQMHLYRFKNNIPNSSYISGFIDGDGCIFIRKIKDGYQSGMSITQSRTNILQVLRYHFGGSITSSANRNNKTENIINEQNYYHKYTQRNQYNLLIRSNECNVLLDYIKNNNVIKRGQTDCLNKFIKLVNLQNRLEEKEELYNICSGYNNKSLLNEINFENINIEYVSGLFDAEGCIYINLKKYSKSYISITQKNHPDVLVCISKLLGFGTIDCEQKFKIYKQADCLKFINLVKDNLIVKYNQALAFETFLITDDKNIKEQMYAICNREKHEIEVFNDLNQNDNGKEGYLEMNKIISLKEQLFKEIHLKQVYREKSEKMTGEGNHNYGKKFTEATKKKMSNSIRDAKGGVSDETIIKVRDLIKEGHQLVKIQDILNLPKHTVSRIKNGEIICRNEEKKEKQPLTQEEINLSKRKILTDEIIIVIERLNEKWKPTRILEYLIDRRNRNNVQNCLTIDIIKNIKRNLTNGKTIIYESELPKEKYDYYLKIINDFSKNLV
jgi:hypothetical protein